MKRKMKHRYKWALLYIAGVLLLGGLITNCATTAPETPPSVTTLNTERGAGLKGYDPVAYFTQEEAKMGLPENSFSYQEVTYHFTSKTHRKLFQAAPENYLPQYGGYCAYAMSINKVADVNPEHWLIRDGKLYLNANGFAEFLWKWGIDKNIQKANQNWSQIYKQEK